MAVICGLLHSNAEGLEGEEPAGTYSSSLPGNWNEPRVSWIQFNIFGRDSSSQILELEWDIL